VGTDAFSTFKEHAAKGQAEASTCACMVQPALLVYCHEHSEHHHCYHKKIDSKQSHGLSRYIDMICETQHASDASPPYTTLSGSTSVLTATLTAVTHQEPLQCSCRRCAHAAASLIVTVQKHMQLALCLRCHLRVTFYCLQTLFCPLHAVPLRVCRSSTESQCPQALFKWLNLTRLCSQHPTPRASPFFIVVA
jgi:hypothetical protein